MAVQYSFGQIVTNGLVLALDAADRNSYPGSGTTWRDLSTSGLNGTLTNGPTFSSVNGGSIVFDGTNDYVDSIGTVSTFSFIQNTGVYTISAWVRPTSLVNPGYFLGNNDGASANKGFFLGTFPSSSPIYLFLSRGVSGQPTISHIVNGFFTVNTWVHVTCVGNGTSNQFYQNGITFSTPSNFSTFSTGDSLRTLAVGRYNNAPGGDNWNGNVANVQIYNRTLSAIEVLQNYNAQKSRFGL